MLIQPHSSSIVRPGGIKSAQHGQFCPLDPQNRNFHEGAEQRAKLCAEKAEEENTVGGSHWCFCLPVQKISQCIAEESLLTKVMIATESK